MDIVKYVFINTFALMILYAMPSVIAYGLGVNLSLLNAVTTTAYVMIIGSYVPIPGGTGGIEYSFMEYLFLRAGYTYEKGLHSVNDCTTWFSGPSAGISLQAPLKKREGGKSSSRLSDGSSPKKAIYGLNTTSVSTRPVLAIDYSYRFTNIMGGVHTFGLRVTM